MSNPKTCFVIAPIGDEGSDTRKRSDQVFKHVTHPVVKQLGYADPEMSHHVNEPGSISTQIIERLLSVDLVVADLTDHNPNVMYELAVRHVVRKPVVQIIQKGRRLPFDIAQQRTIELDHKDLDSAEEARGKLVKQIESVQRDPTQVDSPITVAVNLTSLKGSEKPTDSALVEILSLLQEIRAEQKSRSWTMSYGALDALLTSQAAIEKAHSGVRDAFVRSVNMPVLKGELLAEAVRERAEKNRRRSSSPDTQEGDGEE